MIQDFIEQKSPILWLGEACPVTLSKHLVERCLPMTTTPLSCQIDCCINTKRTTVHSQTESPDHLSSTNSVTIQKADLEALLPKTKVNWIHSNYKFYKVWFRGLVWQLEKCALLPFCWDLDETIDTAVTLYGQCEAGSSRQFAKHKYCK